MATPPSWAHPYATVWDDFGPAVNPALLDSVRAPSGGVWIQEPPGIRLGTVDTIDTHFAYRGLTGGNGRSPVAGGDPDSTNPLVDQNRFVTPCIAVPAATATSAYVRADVYLAHTAGGPYGADAYLLLSSNQNILDYYVPDLARGWVLGFNDEFTVTVDTFDNSFSVDSIEAVNASIASSLNRWINLELRLDGGVVSALVDGTVVGSSAAEWAMEGVYAAFHTNTNQTAAADGAFVANFEAGPIPHVVVPRLAAAAGPQHVQFESPRPI